MAVEWTKLLIGAAIGYVGLSLLKPGFGAAIHDPGSKKARPPLPNWDNIFSNQGFFGFSGPQAGSSFDVQTPNCTPANMTGNGRARYCNPPAGAYNAECSYGVDCADARAVYCRTYARGGVCTDISPSGYRYVAPNQGLPGQGPVIGSAFQDIANSFGYNPYTQQFGSYAPSTVGYGYQPSYNPYYANQYAPGGFGYSQPYGYPPQTGYGYNPYGYNPYGYRSYAVTGYDRSSGHFLYG